MPLPIRVIRLRRGDRKRLGRLTRSRTTPHRVVERARIVLASAAGDAGSAICTTLGVARPTVTLWLDRYEAEGLPGIMTDRARSGRPKRVLPADEAAIVDRTLRTSPPADRSVIDPLYVEGPAQRPDRVRAGRLQFLKRLGLHVDGDRLAVTPQELGKSQPPRSVDRC